MAVGLWLALAAIACAALWHLRSVTLDSQARELNLLSLALTDEVDRGLRGAEEGLHALRTELGEGRLPVEGPEARRALRSRADLMPLVRTLWLVDRDGHVFAASDTTAAPELSSFSPTLDQIANGSTAMSGPFIDANTHQALVALAVPLDSTPGRGGGTMLAAMPAATLLGAFSAALPAADARMLVLRGDGLLLVSTTDGTLAEGSENLVRRHSVPRYQLQVVVSRDLRTVLASWRGAAQLSALAFALLLAIMATALHLVQRADRRRTEAQRALQAQLSRASKLESLGTLAGGVAHDFNNVLAAIVGFGEMAQDAAPPGSGQARHLDKVLRAALRGKALVERILAFSRGGARASTVFELQPVVQEVLGLLSASLRPGVVLERALNAPGARLRGDATQAFEAVMNLCTNAIQAMPAGGMLSVQLESVRIAAPLVLSHSQLAVGGFLVLTVSDQGSGISPEVMEHLFEPFFTTRGAQSGTGLGLAVVFGVVAEFGGAIDVQSTRGQGARFTLYMPECKDRIDPPGPMPAVAPAGAGQRLLVVDDDPELVAWAQEMLQGLGYDPVGTSDSSAALRMVRDDPLRFAAVITDEAMAQLSGMQLTLALREHAPHLPVLLVSGYGGALLAQRAAAAGVNRVLAKPLQRADLARALAELLR